MNYDRICYGCFRERPSAEGNCPYCGYGPHVEHPANTLPPGTILAGRYLTGKVLGVGGFGVTYLAFDMKLEEKCACKEYLPSGMAVRTSDRYTLSVARSENRSAYENGMAKFLNEARILARLKDVPNIVSVRDFFSENGTAYFVMQFVEGQSLKALLKSRGGKLSYEETAGCLLPVMRALRQVHAKQLLHRDISPDNISLTKRGEPVLLDFGAARSSAGDDTTMSVILKHGYAPIEQYSAHGNQGPWTDVYAMGATMYHCLTGMLPPNAVDRLRNDGLVPPSALGVSLPAAAERAILTALSVRAEDRFVSMQAFAEALQGGATVIPKKMPLTPHPASTSLASASPAKAAARVPTARKLPLPLPALVGIAAGVIALVIILALARAGRNRGDEPVASSTPIPTVTTTPPADTPQQNTPAPTPGQVTIDPSDQETYESEEVGLRFRYIPGDTYEFKISEDYPMDGKYRSAIFTYEDVEIDVLRVGSEAGDAAALLRSLCDNMITNMDLEYMAEEVYEGDMGDIPYHYSILQSVDESDPMIVAPYTADINGETVFILDVLYSGSQREEIQQQFGTIASSIELL